MMRKLNSASTIFFAVVAAGGLLFLAFGGATALTVLQHGPLQQAAAVVAAAPRIHASVIAKAAIVYDPSDGSILFAKDADEALPLASLTKLMTAEVLLTAEAPATPVTVSPNAVSFSADEGDLGFRAGDTVTLSDLLKMGLIASSNVAMQAAAESLGAGYVDRMNAVAANLGLTRTQFFNPTGLDLSTTTSGAYSSAYDVARLAALFYKQYPTYFELTQQSSVSIVASGRTLTAAATSLPLLSIPGFLGAKTGYTDLAGGNVVAVFDQDIGHPLVVVVLGSTEDGRFADIETLIDAVRSQQ